MYTDESKTTASCLFGHLNIGFQIQLSDREGNLCLGVFSIREALKKLKSVLVPVVISSYVATGDQCNLEMILSMVLYSP